MAYQNVTLKGTIPDNDLTFVAASDIDVNAEGLVVTQDTSAANTVKLTTDGSAILGRLERFGDRAATIGYNTCTVKLVGGMELKCASSYSAPAVGDKVVGAAGGYVRKATGSEASDITVWEVRDGSVIVIKNS